MHGNLSGTCNPLSVSFSDIALAGQTFSHGLEQSRGQSSGSNSVRKVKKLSRCGKY